MRLFNRKLHARLEALEARVESELSSLRDDIAGANEAVDDLERETLTRGDLETIETDVNEHELRITNLEDRDG